jgi:hypothetical protein
MLHFVSPEKGRLSSARKLQAKQTFILFAEFDIRALKLLDGVKSFLSYLNIYD